MLTSVYSLRLHRNRMIKRVKSNANVLILGAARTPIGSYSGSLSEVRAPVLGSIAIKGAMAQCPKISADLVQECLMGNVIGANLGQAPARQAALTAGLKESTVCTTINKVCASGMKAVCLGAQSIQLGHHSVVVAGGMESMSRSPFYLDGRQGRKGLALGNHTLSDSLIKDGLWDPKYQIHMGSCAEETAEKYKITRNQQDEHAKMSYERAAKAVKAGMFKQEIVTVSFVTKSKGSSETVTIFEDEEYKKVNFSKMSTLKPVFNPDSGTITAANASSISDGASAVLLASEEFVLQTGRGIEPLARIVSYADAECGPKDFPIAPTLAIPLALKRAGLQIKDISLFEINEAFSVVILANQQILKLDPERVNIAGGAVAMGHPIGSSGSRILVTLTHLLKQGQFGCAAICNGGGGATAIIIQRIN